MACLDDDTILAYFRGELVAEVVASIERELDACDTCRELMILVASEWRNNDGVLGDERRPGTTIGRYVVERPLGAGAMGVVYQARDPELARTIALKVMARPSPQLAERFRREAQAMARLSHRNVVQVFDVGGAGAEAFVAMEQVTGTTLRTWIKQRHGRSQILDVFAQAADGLAAAHDAGIVHRDFKPENVLVGDDGIVRVSDFGLAQLGAATELAHGTPTTTPTATAGAGTPAYLAPEVKAGEVASARADQYSYFVALHEALTAARPNADQPRRLADAPKDQPAAAKIKPRRLAAAVARGLAAEPAERWPGMREVARELRAIEHRRPWLAIAAVGALAVAGIAYAMRPAAEQPCATAGSELTMLWPARQPAVQLAIASSVRPYAGVAAANVTARLASYADSWRASAIASCRATHVDHTQSTDLLDRRTACLAQRRAELGAVLDRLADPKVAVSAVEIVDGMSAIAVCDDVATLVAEPVPPHDPAATTAIAAVRAQIAAAKSHFLAGTFAAGLAISKSAVASARAIGHRPLLAEALEVEGGLLTSTGKPEDAIAIFDEGLREAEASQSVRAALAIRLRESENFGELGKDEEALRVAHLGLATAEGIGAAATAADFDVEIGVLESDLGHTDVALAAYQKGLAVLEAKYGKDSIQAGHVVALIGMVLDDLHHHDEALANLRRSLAIERRTYGEGHPNYANALSNLSTHLQHDDPKQALELARQAHAIRVAALDPDHPELAMSWSNLGGLLRDAGQLAEAKADLIVAIAIKEKAMGPTSPSLAVSLLNLSQVEFDLHEYPGSLDHAQRAVEVFTKSLGAKHAYTGKALAQVGTTLDALDRPKEAIPAFEAALPLLAEDPSLYSFQFNLAEALAATHGDPSRIHALATQALANAHDRPQVVATIQRFLRSH